MGRFLTVTQKRYILVAIDMLLRTLFSVVCTLAFLYIVSGSA